jgi:hypothetical protein
MRRLPLVAAAAFALIAAMPPTIAGAQDAAAELLRKAKAGEKDNGFCAGAGLEKFGFGQVQAKLNQLLSQSDAPQRVTWAVTEESGARTFCFHFTFAAPAQREGKKCRATETYACIAGGECKVQAADFICEKSPGQWD